MESEGSDYDGTRRPRQIPPHWNGEPLPAGAGWRWFDPEDRTNAVRLYRGDPSASDPSTKQPYVVITVKGQVIGPDGQPIGETLID